MKRKVIAIALIVVILSVCAFVFGCNDNNNDDVTPPGTGGSEVVAPGTDGSDTTPPETDGTEDTEMSNPTATFIIKDQNGVNRKIVIELYPDKAPVTVNNFVTLAKSGLYNGTVFHRIVPYGCIQGGGYKIVDNTILEVGEDLTPIYGEFKSNGWANNDLKHEKGVISMARTSVKDSATSQFFICVDSYPSWDGEYAAFGKAVDQESLDNLTALGKSTYGNIGGYFNTFPYPILKIVSVTIAEA